MKRFVRLLVCACFVTGLASVAFAQEAAPPPAQSADKTAPSYDLKAQAALDLQQLQEKFTKLAEAIPQEKYFGDPLKVGARSTNCSCTWPEPASIFQP
jgi:hypothetical protein